jgi:hypothetical protein
MTGTEPLAPPPVIPPGLIGEVTKYFLASAPYPADNIAIAGALGFLAGIGGRSYNVSGTGLNQYILILAQTGMGKEITSSGTSRLFFEIAKHVPSVSGFRGPGELVSAPGLIKWLDRNPSIVSVVGEFGLRLREMAAPNANSNNIGLQRALLQLYTKSGYGYVFDPIAYSDKEKNTNIILSPSLTILAESTPSTFYEVLNESMIASGLLPRFMIIEHHGLRPYQNRNKNMEPGEDLIQKLAGLSAHCSALSAANKCQNVAISDDAQIIFDLFEKFTTDKVNENNSEAIRNLWNRAYLKALKLAALCAVGINYFNPIVNSNEANWAINRISSETQALAAKFEKGEVGDVAGNERKQIATLLKVIKEYAESPYERFEKYHGSKKMHEMYVITKAHISQRLNGMAAFKNDRAGATASVRRVIKGLLEDDTIREIPKTQMLQMFGCKSEAYVISDPARVLAADL